MKLKMGRKLGCGGYDNWWVERAVRTLIYEKYKRPVPCEFLNALFKIIKEGE